MTFINKNHDFYQYYICSFGFSMVSPSLACSCVLLVTVLASLRGSSSSSSRFLRCLRLSLGGHSFGFSVVQQLAKPFGVALLKDLSSFSPLYFLWFISASVSSFCLSLSVFVPSCLFLLAAGSLSQNAYMFKHMFLTMFSNFFVSENIFFTNTTRVFFNFLNSMLE